MLPHGPPKGSGQRLADICEHGATTGSDHDFAGHTGQKLAAPKLLELIAALAGGDERPGGTPEFGQTAWSEEWSYAGFMVVA